MGYYSFYRIIKDIIRNFKKNKILVVIAIIILVLFLCNKVFAIDIQMLSPSSIDYKLNVDWNNKICKLNNHSLDSSISNFQNICILNYSAGTNNSDYYFAVFCWNNDNLIFGQVLPNDDRYGVKCNSGFYYNLNYYYYRNTDYSSDFSVPLSRYSHVINNVIFGNANNPIRENNIVFSTADIYDTSGNVIFENNSIKYPKVTTSLEDLQTLNFDTISVSAWDWSNKDLYILFYDRSLMNNQDTQGLYPKKEIKLAKDTSYFVAEISSEKNAIYWIANDNTGLNFKVGGKYEIRLAERVSQSTGRWLSWGRFI